MGIAADAFGESEFRAGQVARFSGYADDWGDGISAVQFSLDDGANWTTYPTEGAVPGKGVTWTFSYIPPKAGRYVLKVRAVDGAGCSSSVVAGFPFDALPATSGARVPQTFGRFRMRAVGSRSLDGARLFRSCELAGIAPDEAAALAGRFGVRTVYDLRTQSEVAAHPEPYIMGVKTIALEPDANRRRKDASRRLVAGVIGEYGAPGKRMTANYRRYANEYPLIGTVMRSIAAERRPAVVHCVNGKDRTGVVCAMMLRVAGRDMDDILEDYLATNLVNAQDIEREAEALGCGMAAEEREILMSFLEARPEYLLAFFDEVERSHGSFDAYVERGLRLSPAQRAFYRDMLG